VLLSTALPPVRVWAEGAGTGTRPGAQAAATLAAKFLGAVRVASFAEGRIGYREWARRNGRLADIHSIDDRYDHDVDELMA
jgi:hypothetical protein